MSATFDLRILAMGFLPCDAMLCTVRPSVRPSVCHTHALCPHGLTYMCDHDFFNHMVAILVSGDIKFIPKLEGDHPERGR